MWISSNNLPAPIYEVFVIIACSKEPVIRIENLGYLNKIFSELRQ